MRITAVDVLPYDLPLAEALSTARGDLTRRRGCLVRLRAERGVAGIGEAAPHPHAADTEQGGVRARLADAAAFLVGASSDRFTELADAAAREGGAVAMGLDMALHDLAARCRGVSVAELLGGRRRPVAASALLGGDTVRESRAALAAGYRAAKLKATADVADVLRSIAEIRAVAPGLSLRVDANGAWDAARAAAFVRAAPREAIEWLEQPLAPDELPALAELRRAARARGLRLALDESVTGPDAVRRIAAAAAADIVVLKLVQVGGLRRALATAREARAAGLQVVVTTGLDTSVGTAAALHLAAALPSCPGSTNDAPAAGVATAHLLAADCVRCPVSSAPVMDLPPGPGLGVELLAGETGADLGASR